ncbi:hypothetical protein F53441_10732 [Fusarium austroafricanum]|uniref:F-box domain-containing protein n=1 Tax=Fusarium austroafricanum TaxID=2364996 RepID=A0A8H4K8A3_9HYPO|nr:hypothetical protein F53441_10732 [Fusarium austroafricanum]
MPILFHQLTAPLTTDYIFNGFDRDWEMTKSVKVLDLPLHSPSSRDWSPLLDGLADRLSNVSHKFIHLWEPETIVQTNLLLALCLNMERLKIQISGSLNSPGFMYLSFLQEILKQRGSGPSLMNLRHLELEESDFGNFSDCGPELSCLLLESPGLKTLVLRGIEEDTIPDYGPVFQDPRCNIALENLTELQIDGWSFNEDRNRGPGPSFTGLKHLELNSRNLGRVSIAGSGLSLLLREAPQLQTLVLYGYAHRRLKDYDASFYEPACDAALGSLAELQILEWCFSEGDLDSLALSRIMGTARKLKRFKYLANSCSGRQESWIEEPLAGTRLTACTFLEYLKQSSKMEHLSLNFAKNNRQFYRLPNLQFITPEQLNGFASLISFELDQSCFCQHLLGRDRLGKEFEKNTCLTDLILPTIRHLSIFLVKNEGWKSPEWQSFDDVLYLGQRAVAGDFPTLQNIELHIDLSYCPGEDYLDNLVNDEAIHEELEQRSERLQETFFGSGVVTRFISDYRNVLD